MEFFSNLMENNMTLFIILCFVIIAAAIAVVAFTLFRRIHVKEDVNSGVVSYPDDLIGKSGVVSETVDADAGTGLVDIDGYGWSARTVYADEVYEVGTPVSVVAIEGVKVIVRADS